MNLHDFYTKAYQLFESVTPLPVDCGKLCSNACCKSEDDEAGMYLFPGEDVMFSPLPSGMQIIPSNFQDATGKPVPILLCLPYCDRRTRPLACRIFPLFPYITPEGSLQVRMDPRGGGMCPLAGAMHPRDLDPVFVSRVRYLGKLMARTPVFYSYLYELSRLIDELNFF